MEKTALLLGGGGMFGAYQAGVWRVLEPFFKPDVVVGVSVGALNGWAIAGGMTAEALAALWLDEMRSPRPPWRWPKNWRDGILDSTTLEGWIRDLYGASKPRCEMAVGVVELWGLRHRLIRDGDITWQTLAASCGLPPFLRLHRFEQKTCIDGGIMHSVPWWAVERVGATRVVAVNVMSPERLRPRSLARQALIQPRSLLGWPAAAMFWDRDNIQRWIEQGERDALAQKQIICDMF